MESTRAGVEFLERSFHATGDDAVDTMKAWCEELLDGRDEAEDFEGEYLTADTQDELVDQLEPLTTGSSHFEKPALWPLVRNVRIAIRGPRILDYIVLVDLPGLDDTKQVRVNASYEMMRSCDTIRVIAKIARVVTDSAVESLLMRFGKYYDMMVICTGIDQDVNKGLAEVMFAEGQSLGEYTELARAEKQLKLQVSWDRNKLRLNKAKLRASKLRHGKPKGNAKASPTGQD